MCIRVPRNKLEDKHLQEIRSSLIFKPRDKKPGKFSTSKPPFPFYRTEGTDVLLPYTFARALVCMKSRRDLPERPKVNISSNAVMREDQVSVFDEAKLALRKMGTVILNLHTACGKTVISLHLASTLGLRVLVHYHSSAMKASWESSCKKFLGIEPWVVGENEHTSSPVVLCMFSRIEKIPRDVLSTIGTFIIDEAHTVCTGPRTQSILLVEPRYIMALTATLDRNDGTIDVIEKMCGDTIVRRRSTKPFEAIFLHTGITFPDPRRKNGTFDWAQYTKILCNNSNRNAHILCLVKSNPTHKVLILTWREDHASYLEKMFASAGEDVDRLSGKKNAYQDRRILVGTYAKIGTGFDEASSCRDFQGVCINMLIHAGSMRSEILIEQVAGRAFRSNFPTIIHYVDETKIAKNHARIASKWYLNNGGTIKKECIS